ncbi:hypothetical protein KR044_011833, partial [Drosophila immigrans]
ENRIKMSFLFFTFSVFAEINAQCSIEADDAKQINYIFAKVIGTQLELLRTNEMTDNTVVRAICNLKSYLDCTCQNGKFKPSLPKTPCANPLEDPKPFAVGDPSCLQPATMYRMGYKLDGNDFLEIYRSCYDVAAQRSNFSIHEIDQNTNSKSHFNPTRAGCWRESKEVVYTSNSYNTESIYNRFEDIFNKQQSYIANKRKRLFDRGHLTPSADFGFCDQMRATNRYFNVVPQFSQINISNWKRVESWVRRMRDKYGKMTVCTGAIGILKLNDAARRPTEIYLAVNKNVNPHENQNPVPEWTYKIIRSHTYSNIHFAIITYNHALNPVTPTMSLCSQIIKCEQLDPDPNSRKKLKLEPNPAPNAGFTFCCEANDNFFDNANLQNLKNVC